MVGVELEGPCGKHDGTVKGREYFRCPPQHGLMLAPSDVVLDHRRADGETRDLAPVDVLPRTQQPVLAYLYQD
ncbi:hypothetical protein M885DRAFT_528127 [Pelagophyceae sp. CCMP2097]|nr:hypothetical protein M885DRAFT_528127 [Pelagophyceae sp. CCMP2097]